MSKAYGLAINLLRDSLQQDSDINKDNRAEVPHILWSSYDRVAVKQVRTFQEYFEVSFCPNNWIGEVQSLYLYPYNDGSGREYTICASEGNHEKLFSCEINDEHLFFALVTIHITQCVKHNSKVLPLVLERLAQFTNPKNINFQAFNSLGSEDVVLIFLGDRISDIIKSVYFLRNIVIKDNVGKVFNFCSTTYSVMGQNYYPDTAPECYEEDEAIAQVFLSLKDNMRASDFKDSLKNAIDSTFELDDHFIEMLIGEYDIQLTINATDLFLNKFYSNDGILIADSPLYNKYILNSKTVWLLKHDKLQGDVYPSNEINLTEAIAEVALRQNSNLNFIIETLKHRRGSIEEKIEKESKCAQPNNNIIAVYQDVLLFIRELIKIMSSSMHSEWVERLISIAEAFDVGIENFFKVMTNDADIREIVPRTFENKVLELNRILCSLRNALSHISKSGEHFYNLPHPSIYYSGSAHKVLMTYYNFIDMVLSLGYLKPHTEGTEQSSISYFITFGMTNKVKTRIYFKTSTTQNNRLVGFELPYAALYDFNKYIPALLHEVYHLIAPTDRKTRNVLLLNMTLRKILKPYILKYVEKLLGLALGVESHTKNVSLIFQVFPSLFLDKEYDKILEMCVRFLQGFYSCKMSKGDVLCLDQMEFICLIKNFFKDAATFSGYLDSIIYEFNVFFSDSKNQEVLLDYWSRLDDSNDNSLALDIFNKINTDSDISLQTFNAVNCTSFITEEQTIVAIKETICDVFFIDILEFNMIDYLRYMLDFFKENCLDHMWESCSEVSSRISMVICYYYGTIDANNPEWIDSVREWLTNSLSPSEFTEEERNKVVKTFLTFVEEFKEQLPILRVLLQYDIIKNISWNIDEKLRGDFQTKTTRIKETYNLLSNNNLSLQFNTILSLQRPKIAISKNTQKIIPQVGYTDANISFQAHLQHVYELPTSGDLGYFLSLISTIKKLYENENEDLWFRGICNSRYDLIPSLYRTVPEIPNTNPAQKYVPFGYQSIMIKQAYAQTKVYYKLLEKNETPLAVRHAFLQHYGVKTNFLDFSTNPLAALYWALNPDEESDRRKISEAVVYVFSPKRYQNAINTIKQKHGLLTQKQSYYLYPYHTHNCMSEEYVISDMSDENILRQVIRAEKYQKSVDKNKYLKYQRLPIATVVPQKNDRILAQSGCFVAYNLLSAKDPENAKEPFNYLSLEKIQNEYLRVCNDGQCFLHRILIPVGIQDNLNHALTTIFDYSLSKVYPDVDKLFSDSGKIVKEYFKHLSN